MINCPSSIADVDFFRDAALVADPYPMLARMRGANKGTPKIGVRLIARDQAKPLTPGGLKNRCSFEN